LKKHGISFEEAKTAFSDDFARLIAYPDHSQEESVRIISAPKADKKERKIYENFRYA
jgi:uncharacterized DUF497 family protein